MAVNSGDSTCSTLQTKFFLLDKFFETRLEESKANTSDDDSESREMDDEVNFQV